MMSKSPDAWVQIPTEAELRAQRPSDLDNPYDFGFLTGMERLLLAHGQIGRSFLRLFGQIMFAPGHLSRAEREMVAAVAAAAQDCHY
jgi:hypothetical protein